MRHLFISLIVSLLGPLSAFGQNLVTDLQPYLNSQGKGQVVLAGKNQSHVGACRLQIKPYKDTAGSYNAISIQFETSSTEFVLDNMIETARRKSDQLIYEMQATADYSGDICGSFAPAKKVVRRVIISPRSLEIQRTYRCPYFLTSTTDSWACHF
ncbi:hypothetical protein [Bdellovibrio sp. HCB2-146]|uniref:hypothetical protein n=1 Tax=Bdellovibrio sp. HCB2-146 TaxID=3394362 RepID=UPI0039BC9053